MRQEDWPERLAAYIDTKRNEPFKWGANDCALFAHGAVCAMVKDHPVSELVFRYRTEAGAKKWLADKEVSGLWEFLDQYFERIPAIMVKRGDLVGHITTDESVGVCLGGFFATPSENGLVFAELSDTVTAWRVE